MTKRQLGSEAEVLNDSTDSSNCVSNNNNITNNNNPISSKKVKLELDSACSPSSSDTPSQVVTVATSSLTTSSTSPTAMTTLNGTSSHDSMNGTLNSGIIDDSNSPNSPPSKVVHIRNISSEANESDLMNLGLPFGKIANILLLKGKNQGLIEFQDLSSAQCMVSYWQMNSLHSQPTVRGRHVYCQFSNHQQLNKQQQQQSDNANNSSNGHMSPNTNPFNTNNSSNNNNSDLSTTETSVLRIVVDQLLYPVTLDNFYQLCSRYGKVTKIVTFQKNASLQALIQFESVSYAVQAKAVLDGTPMFGSQTMASNILRVSFSKLANLNVKYNNDKSRDYTNPNLPSGIPNTGSGSGGGYTGSSSEMGHMAMDPIALAAFAATHGPNAVAALGFPHPGQGNSGSGSGSNHHHSSGSHLYGNSSHSRQNTSMSGHPALLGFGTVVLVSNIPEQLQNPDSLFTLFGVYGDVTRVKVLFNKKDNALIQMSEPQQTSLAFSHLDRLKIFGKTMRVTCSKHQLVQLPKEGQPDSGLTKDYTNSPLHRFKKPGSKNYSNIYPPSGTLHLSNIPATISEDELRGIFARVLPSGDASIVNFKFFPKDRKMALISLDSLDDAILCLVKLHNYQLGESSHLRVSFSKSNL